MEGELVERPSFYGVGEEEKTPTPSYTKIFWDCLPSYMAMGMSVDEYFNGDPQLAVSYRELQKIKNEQENYRLWLQGMYVYQSILLCAPRLNTLKPKKPENYPKKPFDLNAKPEKEETFEDKNIVKMKAWMEKVNKHYEQSS